ncbi:hypothetical protein [Flavobacterium sp.]|uniref:hypothetical protein n=1 Tax=Flavobacterium sp. TaxID=239 RepID=UPI00262E4105|nr:hypothetical protein [Flavobacterium sp.]
MKNIFLMLFVSIGLFTSCVEKPEEDPDTTPPVGDMQIDFDGQRFTSVTTQVVLNDTSLMIKGVGADGAFFIIAVPSMPVVGTYTWDEFGPTEAGFSIEYHPANGSDPYIAARDDSGEFANFSEYTDTAELVITAIDRTNKRIYGSFKFTGVRFADVAQTAVNTKVFTSGTFFSLPYTATEVVNPSDNSIVPIKIEDRIQGTGVLETSTVYTYDATNARKIKKEVSTDADGFVDTLTYTYSGDLITKIEDNVNGVVLSVETFEYNGANKLISYISTDIAGDNAIKEVYTYNPDGSIGVTRFTGDLTAQTTPDGTSVITFLNGEVSKIEFSSGQVKTYTYDTKNNPFKNVIGFAQTTFVDGEAQGMSKNITNEVIDLNPTSVFTYMYNLSDFPTTSNEDSDYTHNYFY